MLEKMGRPPGKNDKHITCLIFTVFTADMLEEKGRPGKNGKIVYFFFDFYRADASD